MKIKLEQATPKQLRRLATNSYGINFPNYARPPQMIAKLRDAGCPDEIEVADEAEAQPAKVLPVAGSAAKASDKVRIMIAREAGPAGAEPVKASVNGSLMLIPRGEPVEIPRHYYTMLMDAVEIHYDEMTVDGETTLVPREVPALPIQRLA